MPLAGAPIEDFPPVPRTVFMLLYIPLSFLTTSYAFGLYLGCTGITGGSFAAIGSVGSIIWPYLRPNLRAEGIEGITVYIWGVSFGSVISLALLGVDLRSVITAILGISLGLHCHLTALKFGLQELYFFRYICLSFLFHSFLLWTIDDSSLFTFQLYGAIVTLMLYVTAYGQAMVGNVPIRDGDFAYSSLDIHIFNILIFFTIYCLMDS